MNTELWASISDFEGLYEISSLGKVKRVAPGRKTFVGKVLTPLRHSDGYQVVMLTKEGTHHTRYVHRLVATAFLPHTANRSEVNHIDGDKTNPALANLEWVTESEQRAHAWRIGLQKAPKLTPDKVRTIRAELATGARGIDLAAQFGVARSTISNIRSGKIWGWLK